MGVSIWEGNKAERVAGALESLALSMAGSAADAQNWKGVQNLVRAGMGAKAFPVGTQFLVEKETSLSASLGAHTGITAATVTEETFLAAEGVVGSGLHEFKFDGAVWIYNGEPVNLATYGIGVTGTPAEGDEILITEAFQNILFDVVDHRTVTDPVDGVSKPAMILMMHHVIYGRPVDEPEALIYAAEAIAAGSYKFKCVNDPWTNGNNDKYFYFTLAQAVPAGGQIVVSAAYNAALSGCTVKTYSGPSSTTAIETTTLSDTEIADATDLGTCRSGNVNDIARAKVGSNNYKESALRQWINSKAAANGWWAGTNIFDRPSSYANQAGLLHGMDADFLAVVRAITVACKTNNTFELSGWTLNTAYSVEDKFFLASRDELGWGTENVAEGSVFKAYNGAANVDRIKYDLSAQSTARLWWLRSPSPSRAYHVRFVYTDGSLDSYRATNGNGAVAACAIL